MSLARRMAVMRNAPFLRLLGEDALKLLAFGSDPVNLKPRQSLFEAGEPADGAVLVLGGQLRLIAPIRGVAPRVAGVGQLVDEVALIVPTQRVSSALAQSSCEVLGLPRERMLRVLEEYPDAAQKLQNALLKRTQTLIQEVGGLADRAPAARL